MEKITIEPSDQISHQLVNIPEPADEPVKDYRTLSALSMFFFIPVGIFAIAFSTSTRQMLKVGNYESARKYSKRAKTFSIIAIVAGIVLLPPYIAYKVQHQTPVGPYQISPAATTSTEGSSLKVGTLSNPSTGAPQTYDVEKANEVTYAHLSTELQKRITKSDVGFILDQKVIYLDKQTSQGQRRIIDDIAIAYLQDQAANTLHKTLSSQDINMILDGEEVYLRQIGAIQQWAAESS